MSTDEPTPIHDEVAGGRRPLTQAEVDKLIGELREVAPITYERAPEFAELEVAEFDPFPSRLMLLATGALSGVFAAVTVHLLGVWFG